MVAVIMAGGTISMFLWEYKVELARGTTQLLAISEAQTMAVTTMVLFQIFYLINCRSLKYPIAKIGFFSNPSIFIGIIAVLLAQLTFVYSPFMNSLFHSSSLKAEAWAISAALAFSIVPVIGIEKWIRKKYIPGV